MYVVSWKVLARTDEYTSISGRTDFLLSFCAAQWVQDQSVVIRLITKNSRHTWLEQFIVHNKIKNKDYVNWDIAWYGKSSAHSCKTNYFMTFYKLQ